MSYSYTNLRGNTVLPLLAEYGETVTLTHVEPGTYDETTMITSASVTTTLTASAIIEDYTQQQRVGTEILETDKKVTGYFSTAPEVGDTIQTSLGTLRVISVVTIAPGGVPVLQEVQCRA